MKTLKERINESNLYELKKFIKDEMQSDFTHALDLLKSANSTTGLMLGVNNYIENVRNPLKNDGYYLAMLFESSGLNAQKNINIIKNIIEKNNQLDDNELHTFLHNVLNFNKISYKHAEKIFNINDFLENKTNNILTDYCNKFKNLAEYIFYITTYIKPGPENKTIGIGNGELLIQLFFGSPDSANNTSGDVNTEIDGKRLNIEIKSGRAGLGSSSKNNYDISDKFLENVKTILNKNVEDMSIMNQYEYQSLNKIMKLTTDDDEKEKIFNCFVSVILSRYISDTRYDNKVCDALKDSFYRNKIINGEISKSEIKYFVGLLHIIGYKLQKEFNYLCVTNDAGNFYNIKCDSIEDIINTFNNFDNIYNIIDFERSSISSADRTNVYVIKLRKNNK